MVAASASLRQVETCIAGFIICDLTRIYGAIVPLVVEVCGIRTQNLLVFFKPIGFDIKFFCVNLHEDSNQPEV